LKTIDNIISIKKKYNKPEVFKISLDNTISLIMASDIIPIDPPPPPGIGGSKGTEPFQSPFGDKPFG
jgi:hypothetical protein